MTKLEEIQLVHATIRALPDSYLRDILETERPTIVNAIENDMTFIDLGELSRIIIAEREALRAVQAEIMIAKRTLFDAQKLQSRLDDSIRELRSTARHMASI